MWLVDLDLKKKGCGLAAIRKPMRPSGHCQVKSREGLHLNSYLSLSPTSPRNECGRQSVAILCFVVTGKNASSRQNVLNTTSTHLVNHIAEGTH